ncbi:hypothetical protein OJAV_G00080420 [Oryzias javanicus]|uniref:Uncharacterized protein n=1 Tax=Oryzias javanicus TaxID=123683 RepID=A0A3S2MYW7_ORYJA|nr:hypothetical protein OJAV_G00080420 [Oryzias javanicus]
MIWNLGLLCLTAALGAVHAGPIRSSGKLGEKPAPREEVNVLMFGVIQLSESLNYVYETTGAKIERIHRTLKNHEGTLQKLGKQAELAAEVEKQMKEVIQLLQAQMFQDKALTQKAKEQLSSLERDEEELKTKVQKLETFINNHTPTSIKELQERAQMHSNMLKGLQLLNQLHKENIETQNEHLSQLETMSEAVEQS